jgi:DeoR/GlpR family transcriptional regulator of sugar metabolism
MSADTRRDAIAAYVIARGEARIDELCAEFAVSRMTIHRHIDQLAQQGVLRKLHGGVSAQPSAIYESLFLRRQTVAQAQKQALARAALRLVEPGQVLMLDDSSTANAVAPLLPGCGPLTVVTNSLPAIAQLTRQDGIDLICLGGQYHPTYDACIGHLCETALAGLRANLLICSASAVDGLGCFIQDAQVVRVKQAMMASSARRVLLVDSGKFGRTALHRLGSLAEFDTVLVDNGLPAALAQDLRTAGVALQMVEVAA